ncbi:putative antirepressor [Escherichia coli TW09195]|nr:putative antirepressor [Escherichia coli TW09195]EJE70455.1 hypothetical protein ECO9634_24745 [Escherichia coli O111:H8 str. CVM9634]BBK46994.1 putative phage regulatory protein [Escherichia coli O145:H28]BCI48992.1 putative phage regulatory protein [Stx2a-converting phage Stx2_14040]BCI49156.1 putative phage regulatory protein [Stx2a-converting phage Stx2_14744]GDR53591.1 hypothetical protein BvCmsNSP012_01207 [Escherichia coli]
MLTGNTCKYSIAGSVMEGDVASTLYAGSLKHSGLFTCVMVIRMNASARCGCFVVILLSVKRHQHIDSAIPGRYTVLAPYKAGAGICTPELSTAIYDAPASFLSSALTHARIMVGWAGEPKGSPVSVDAGSANPVQSATSEICTSGGGSFPQSTEAAIMATVPVSPYLKIEVVNGRAVIFSLYVACHFKRMHKNIVDRIEYLNCSREFLTRNFIPGTYRAYGDLVRGYYITRDGLMMLQLGLSLRTMRYYESCIDALHEVETVQGHSAFRRNQREVRP